LLANDFANSDKAKPVFVGHGKKKESNFEDDSKHR
jgi:hypothetical protein